jgi:glycosyltransferase involved in cell wall biosynthesis
VGFLNKSFPEQYDKYIQIVQMCHLFLLPTRAECAGIVFGECSAYGIPIYTYDTGGIGDYVFNEQNGYRLPITAGPEEFAEKIVSTLSVEKQQSLHEGCLRVYRERLSWNVWSNGFRHILQREFKTE